MCQEPLYSGLISVGGLYQKSTLALEVIRTNMPGLKAFGFKKQNAKSVGAQAALFIPAHSAELSSKVGAACGSAT